VAQLTQGGVNFGAPGGYGIQQFTKSRLVDGPNPSC
jgi:hypothetical protein